MYPEQVSQLQGVVEKLKAVKGVKHVILAVESRDGSLSWTGTAGVAQTDGSPIEADTPFWIASVTKLFIASTVLLLHETGRLSIDDFIINYLPEHLLKGVHVVNGVDYFDKLTIRHLLGHSSGIPDYLELKPKGEKPLFERALDGGDMSWSIEDILEIVEGQMLPSSPPSHFTTRRFGYDTQTPTTNC